MGSGNITSKNHVRTVITKKHSRTIPSTQSQFFESASKLLTVASVYLQQLMAPKVYCGRCLQEVPARKEYCAKCQATRELEHRIQSRILPDVKTIGSGIGIK